MTRQFAYVIEQPIIDRIYPGLINVYLFHPLEKLAPTQHYIPFMNQVL